MPLCHCPATPQLWLCFQMMYEGLSFVRAEQEAALQADLTAGVLLHRVRESSDVDNTDKRKLICSTVGKWLATAVEGDYCVVTCPENVLPFLLSYEIRISFPNVWTKQDATSKEVRIKILF